MKNSLREFGNFDLSGKCAIITGGGSGIGLSIATLFTKKGARVIILDSNTEAAHKAVNSLQGLGNKPEYFTCDITDENKVKLIFTQIRDRIASPDILVNSAGISNIGTAETTSTADFQKIFDVNVKGTFLCIQEFLKVSGEDGSVILNIASIAASAGLKDRFAYSMSKGAILAMTYSVAIDYIDRKVRCNSISPARIHTPFVDGFVKKTYPGREDEMMKKLSLSQPIGRMGTPEEVAALALYLCSDEASFITGSDYALDGGFLRLK